MLHAGARDTDCIHFLERVFADEAGRHLAADHHQRDGIHVGRGDAGDGIGHAGAGSHQRHADLVGRARVAVRGMHRGLLVANQHVFDLFLLEQLIVDEEHRAAGVAEYVLDAFFLQTADGYFCACQFHESTTLKKLRKTAQDKGWRHFGQPLRHVRNGNFPDRGTNRGMNLLVSVPFIWEPPNCPRHSNFQISSPKWNDAPINRRNSPCATSMQPWTSCRMRC